MSNYIIDIQFIDASNWQQSSWYNIGGTRAKKVLQDPEGKEYYFKCSEKKPAKDGKLEKYYKYEFWNEIIAYQLGKCLGLNTLRYDVAVFNGEIGCISPKMIVTDEEQLLDLGRFMTAFDPDFLPEDNSTRNKYTFQLLEQTLQSFKIIKYWEFIFQTILFDAIISNTDRHQENWAFIGQNTFMVNVLNIVEDEVKRSSFAKAKWIIRKFYKSLIDKDKNQLNAAGKKIILETINISRVAPIFDNGSSMARELSDDRIELLLSNEVELNKYIENGKAELHWEGKKISHYNLIEELLNSSYQDELLKASIFLKNWDKDLIVNIIANTEMQIPEQWKSFCIPNNRKNLIIKLITLRCERLNTLIHERVR